MIEIKYVLSIKKGKDSSMRKVFISQPMRGKSNEQIIRDRDNAIRLVKNHYNNEELEILDTFYKDFNGSRLEFLAKSIYEGLAHADIVVFLPRWAAHDGCYIEHEIAYRYQREILYINDSWMVY